MASLPTLFLVCCLTWACDSMLLLSRGKVTVQSNMTVTKTLDVSVAYTLNGSYFPAAAVDPLASLLVNLVIHLKFDEATATSVVNSIGGSVVNAPTPVSQTVQPGVIGNARRFAVGALNYLTVPVTLDSSMSWSYWFRAIAVDGMVTETRLVQIGGTRCTSASVCPSDGTQKFITTICNSGKPCLQTMSRANAYVPNTAGTRMQDTLNDVDDGNWHFMSCSLVGSSGTFTWDVDGRNVYMNKWVLTVPWVTAENFVHIGSASATGSIFEMDDFRVWTRRVDAAEFAQLVLYKP